MEGHPRFGVFLLPNVVLFPQAKLALHVFEPRYRALVTHALRGTQRFVVAVPSDDFGAVSEDESDGIHPVACVGRIVQHEVLPDGRFDVVVVGESVVRIEEWIGGAAFRIARVVVQQPEACFAEGPEREQRLRELEELLDSACPGSLASLRERIGESLSDGALELLHTVAMNLPVDLPRKLEWLGCRGSLDRWKAICGTLRYVAAGRALRERTISRYSDCLPEDPRRN